MITDQNMHELLHFQPEHPVLSVYLNTDPVEGTPEFHRLRLRSMLKEAALTEEGDPVTQFIDHEHDWSGRSVVIFSCPQQDYFRAFPLAIPIRSRVRVGDRPYVKPLADLIDSFGGYGVVLVDKQGGRLFHFHLGELQEQQGILGESVHRTKRGGGSQEVGRRGGSAGQTEYIEELTERNMREVVDTVTRFFFEKKVRRIVIGGTDDNVAMFRGLLPKSWQSLVVGSFPISMLASENEVLAKAMEIGEEAEKQRENNLVKMVVTNTAKGRGGVIGLQDTMDALRQGRIQTLIILEGYREPGMRCMSCGYLTSQPLGSCPFCGGKFEKIPDAVEMAVSQVMRMGGEVEVLHSDQFIDQFGKIGAQLRY